MSKRTLTNPVTGERFIFETMPGQSGALVHE